METTLAVTTVPFGGSPSWTAYDQDTVWIGDQSAGQVVRLDAHSGRIIRRTTVGADTERWRRARGAACGSPTSQAALYRLDQRTDAGDRTYPLWRRKPVRAQRIRASAVDRRLRRDGRPSRSIRGC